MDNPQDNGHLFQYNAMKDIKEMSGWAEKIRIEDIEKENYEMMIWGVRNK
jgi:hypothetical protein